MSKLVRLENPIHISRKVFLNQDQGYGIGRTGLIASRRVIDDYRLKMYVNGLYVDLPFLDGKEFNIAKIREALRDVIPMTEEETQLCNIEATLFGTQLLGTEYYRYFPSKFLFNYIFTGELCITFEPMETHQPQRIEIEETYVISEAQLVQKLDAGTPLEKIGGEEEGISMGL